MSFREDFQDEPWFPAFLREMRQGTGELRERWIDKLVTVRGVEDGKLLKDVNFLADICYLGNSI